AMTLHLLLFDVLFMDADGTHARVWAEKNLNPCPLLPRVNREVCVFTCSTASAQRNQEYAETGKRLGVIHELILGWRDGLGRAEPQQHVLPGRLSWLDEFHDAGIDDPARSAGAETRNRHDQAPRTQKDAAHDGEPKRRRLYHTQVTNAESERDASGPDSRRT